MTTPDCLAFQQAVFEAGDGAALLERRPDLAAHRDACPGCRVWLEAFMAGVEAADGAPGLAAGVLARTAGGACARARELAASEIDEPLAEVDRALVASHLEACAACRAVVTEMTASVAALRELAEIDPGPAFTARVLAATSRRPARVRAFDWWRRQWAALVARPRFALETAYALTLVLVLVAGNPLAAFEWTAARVEPLVERVGAPVEALDARVRALRDRVAGATQASEDRPSLGAAFVEWTRRTWDDFVAAVSSGLVRFVDAVESTASWVRDRAGDLLGRAQAAATEPGAGNARSPF